MVKIDLGHDFTIYPVQGDLTADGVQYSTEIETTDADTDIVLFSYSFDLDFGNIDKWSNLKSKRLLWVYFEIHCMLKAETSVTADIKFKAQARNKDGTWTDLFDYVTYEDIGIVYLEKTYKGYAILSTTINEVPFDFRIVFQCNEVDEGRGQLKNTSYFRAIFKEIE